MAISTLSVVASNPRLLPSLSKPHRPAAFFAKNAAFPFPSPVSSSSLPSRDSGEEAAPSSTAGLGSVPVCRRRLFEVGIGLLASFLVDMDAKATRIEYYATVGEPLCDMSFAKSGLGYCDVAVGTGVQPPRGELINIHYTARFDDGTVFDSSYKRGRPLTLRIGVGKVQIAKAYEENGAACLSILTDEKYFQGSFENLEAVRRAGVKCPLLCKEFIIDSWQIYYARSKGLTRIGSGDFRWWWGTSNACWYDFNQ